MRENRERVESEVGVESDVLSKKVSSELFSE